MDIDAPFSAYQGLFGYVGAGKTTIRGLRVESALVEGLQNVGILIGSIDLQAGEQVLIEDTLIQGEVVGRGEVGGVIGDAFLRDEVPFGSRLTVDSLSLDVRVARTDGSVGDRVGGMIGFLEIENEPQFVLGSILQSARFHNIDANVQVIGGDNFTGGLIGRAVGNYGISDARVQGTVWSRSVNFSRGSFVGGLVGGSRNGSFIRDVSFTGIVDGGGVVGAIAGEVFNAGNLNTFKLKNAAVSSTVLGNSGAIGGIVGSFIGNVEMSRTSFNGQVINPFNSVGGLVGYLAQDALVRDSEVRGKVQGRVTAGGAFGILCGQVERVSAFTDVIGIENVGGFFGDSAVGCFLTNGANVTDSYSRGTVRCIDNCRGTVGGFGGFVDNISITHSYTDSTMTIASITDVGGFIGRLFSNVTLTQSFWDREATGQQNSPGEGAGQLEGKTSAQMRDPQTFLSAGWDLANIWFPPAQDPPTLR